MARGCFIGEAGDKSRVAWRLILECDGGINLGLSWDCLLAGSLEELHELNAIIQGASALWITCESDVVGRAMRAHFGLAVSVPSHDDH